MPKRPLRKSSGRKPTTIRAKKAAAKKTASKKPAPQKNFMWKLLERKQAELKRMVTHAKHPFAHADAKPHEPYVSKANSYARYNGPRRKAA